MKNIEQCYTDKEKIKYQSKRHTSKFVSISEYIGIVQHAKAQCLSSRTLPTAHDIQLNASKVNHYNKASNELGYKKRYIGAIA